MEVRRERGKAIAAQLRIGVKNGFWIVPSTSGNGHYRVCLEPPTPFVPRCNCPDHELRRMKCKHIFAVEFHIEAREKEREAERAKELAIAAASAMGETGDSAGATESPPEPPPEPPTPLLHPVTTRKRKTYPQVWPAYHKAQTREKHDFQRLLADLCRGIEEPLPTRDGRPALPLRDAVFSVAFKVYSTVSCRRFQCDLDDAQARGHISKAPHYNSVFRYFEDPGLTPILTQLIAESSLPLRAVEKDYAVDSSGFTGSRFERWVDIRYGVVKAQHSWVKAHVMAGVTTNVVTAVRILDKYSADCPQFAPLLAETVANGFKIGEVSADTAFSSYENHELVTQAGGVPYLAFRSNAAANRGGIFAKMFHLYSLNREEFLAHYHKRSNVESVFSMVKAKFGDHLRSKTDTAMVNETLGKILCHNVCCLIQSYYELGIKAEFWGEGQEVAGAEKTGSGADDLVGAMAWM